MTHPTKAVYKFMMQDYVRMRCVRHAEYPATESDIHRFKFFFV